MFRQLLQRGLRSMSRIATLCPPPPSLSSPSPPSHFLPCRRWFSSTSSSENHLNFRFNGANIPLRISLANTSVIAYMFMKTKSLSELESQAKTNRQILETHFVRDVQDLMLELYVKKSNADHSMTLFETFLIETKDEMKRELSSQLRKAEEATGRVRDVKNDIVCKVSVVTRGLEDVERLRKRVLNEMHEAEVLKQKCKNEMHETEELKQKFKNEMRDMEGMKQRICNNMHKVEASRNNASVSRQEQLQRTKEKQD